MYHPRPRYATYAWIFLAKYGRYPITLQHDHSWDHFIFVHVFGNLHRTTT